MHFIKYQNVNLVVHSVRTMILIIDIRRKIMPKTESKNIIFVTILYFQAKSFCNLQVNCIFVYNFGIVMTDEEKKRLSTFEARLRHLIYLHDELKRENAELKQLLKIKDEECKQVQAEYGTLEADYTNLKTAMTISLNGSDVKETKLRLSKLVREVDKCIALLNE